MSLVSSRLDPTATPSPRQALATSTSASCILINGFITLPEFASMTFEEIFDPLNGYGNFQSLLNTVPVPSNHAGFYLNKAKKAHLQSKFLSSPVAATPAVAFGAKTGGLFTFGAPS